MEPNQTPIQPAPEVVSEPTKKSLPKWPLIIVGIILLATLLTGTFILYKNTTFKPKPASKTQPTTQTVAKFTPTPTPDPTATWKTFTATKYNFSIKYPSNLNAEEFLTPFYSVTFKTVGAAQGEFSTYDLLASPDTFIAKDPAAYDFLSADVVDELTAMTPNATKQIATSIFTKLPNTVIDGQPAIAIGVKSAVDNTTNQTRVFIKHGGNMYMIVNNQNSDQADFDNIISTFKFTSQITQATTETTSNLKTYSQDGINFQYPKSWIEKDSYWMESDKVFYDLNSIQTFTGNGDEKYQRPTIYFDLQSVMDTAETATQYADKQTAGIPYTKENQQRQTIDKNGIEYVLFTVQGEGNFGKFLEISNGKKLVIINTSLESLSGNNIENQILSSFRFTQ